MLFTPFALAKTIINKILTTAGAVDFSICKPGGTATMTNLIVEKEGQKGVYYLDLGQALCCNLVKMFSSVT